MSFIRNLLAARALGPADSSLKDVLVSRPGVISFAGGLPDEKAFDLAAIREIAAEVSADRSTWQYTETEGWLPLREQVAAHMSKLGVACSAANVLITQGSQQALDLVGKLLLDPGDRVLIEAPGYLGAIQAFESYEATLVPVALDDDGIIPASCDAAAQSGPAKLLYTVSTFQNPTGATLAPKRRQHLLHAAERFGGLILEDGAYHHLAYDAPAPPPLAAQDPDGRVVYMGSFSKSLLPGVRVGWIVARPEIIEHLSLLKQAGDLASNTFGQRFVATWLDAYGLTPPVDLYRTKRDLALAALQEHMPEGVTWNRPQGGFFLWLRLPEHLDAVKLARIAQQTGVSFVPGVAFGGPSNTLRFSFSQVDPDDIDEGVRRLAQAIGRALER